MYIIVWLSLSGQDKGNPVFWLAPWVTRWMDFLHWSFKTNFFVCQDSWTLALFFYMILLALTQFITKLKRTRPISSHYDKKRWDNNAYMNWCWVNNAYMDCCCIKHCFMGECLTEKLSGMRDTCTSIADQVILGKEISKSVRCFQKTQTSARYTQQHSWVSCGPTFQLNWPQYFWCPGACCVIMLWY